MIVYRVLDRQGRVVHSTLDRRGRHFRVLGDLASGWKPTGVPVEVVRRLPPVAPPVIFGVGLNYRSFVKQLGAEVTPWPLIFMKQGSCVVGHGDAIELPAHLPSQAVDYEGELAVVIGRPCKNATPSNALDFVAGYTCANDVTARDWQFEKGNGQFSRSKTFDTFCPLGPGLLVGTHPESADLRLRTIVNGELRQEADVSDLVFSITDLICFLSGSTTLQTGTVILTGTPGGAGSSRTPPAYLRAGDVVEVEISGVGHLVNPVRGEAVAQSLPSD